MISKLPFWRQQAGTIALLLACGGPAAAQVPTKNLVTDFGAIPNDTGNDQAAFTLAEDFFQANPAGAKLIIPEGRYVVGLQSGPRIHPYYHGDDVLSLQGCHNAVIEGQGFVTVAFEYGLKFGIIDGVRWAPGVFIKLEGCDGVQISNLHVYGGSDGYDFGGVPSNTRVETDNDGIFISDSYDITVDSVSVDGMGRDGIMARFSDGTYLPGARPLNLKMTNCHFDYNGRDGFSWVGGFGVVAHNCTFNHQAQRVIKAGLKDGIDIEPEGGNYLGNGIFYNCEFSDNWGVGMLADYAYGEVDQAQNVKFTKCTFTGITPGAALEPKRPYFSFTSCLIYGELRNAYNAPDDLSAVKFSDCLFNDWRYYKKETTGRMLVELYHSGARMLFDRCSFTIHSLARGFTQIDNLTGGPTSEHVRFRDCKFNTAYNQAPSVQTNNSQTRTKASGVTFEGECSFLFPNNSDFGPRPSRAAGTLPIQVPMTSIWPALVTGNLTLAGGPDIMHLIETGEKLQVTAGGVLNIDDRNELNVYADGSTLQIDEGGTVVVKSGGMLSSVGGGRIILNGTLIVKAGGYICLDFTSPAGMGIVLGPNGRLVYEPGANLTFDPLRYPPVLGGKNCDGTPPSASVAVTLSPPSFAPSTLKKKSVACSWEATATNGAGNYSYSWQINVGDGRGFQAIQNPRPYLTYTTSMAALRTEICARVSVSSGGQHAEAESCGIYSATLPEQPLSAANSAVFPNPADHYLEVDLNQAGFSQEDQLLAQAAALAVDSSPLQATLYDAQGKVRFAGTFPKGRLRIDASALPNGIYHLRVIGQGKTVSQQVVVQH